MEKAKYRFRIIQAGSYECGFEFPIQNHNFTIIASDGKYAKPFEAAYPEYYYSLDQVVKINRRTTDLPNVNNL